MRIHVGCSGWFYSHWRGIFYPRQEVATKNWFAYYANVFDTVELNAPFYRWPKPGTVRRWKRDAPPGFIYTVKVNQLIRIYSVRRRSARLRALWKALASELAYRVTFQYSKARGDSWPTEWIRLITHEQRMVRTKKLVQSYYEIAATLEEKMGCFLFQFPPSYRYTAARLKSIVTQLDPAQRNAVEFRHKSWWREPVYRALAGAEEAWIYFNNDRNGYAIKNALVMRRMLRAAG